jgi:Fic family protein
MSAAASGDYPHWDDVRRRPAPKGLSRTQVWLGLKLSRASSLRPIPLRATSGQEFRYSLPDRVLELLHWIDQHAAGEIAVSEAMPDTGDRRRYLVNSLIEEAITSSQLEGAATTRRVAKEMLRTGRRPRDRHEQMILNNYRAMSDLGRLRGQSLTVETVNDLHRTLTDRTLDDPSAAGRPQRPGEDRVRVFDPDGVAVHIPPPAEELEDRMRAMCDFANGPSNGRFMHPVIRAILLHLWLACDHPYEDGNGRTARALFYREMLAQGYWLFEYVSISRLLLRAPAQYARSFLHTETDEYDATYFILHQLEVIRQAIEELTLYLERKTAEARETVSLLRRTDLNHRQVALLTHALRHPDTHYTVRSHAGSHRVTRQSARTDLQDLEARGLLQSRRSGRAFEFFPVDDLAQRIEAIARTAINDRTHVTSMRGRARRYWMARSRS